MDQMNDIELVWDYVARDSQEAFATLVQRHISLVYSVALRHVGDPSKAEDITQAVFIALARRARSLRRGTVLAGWLHQVARNISVSSLRAETRRRRREQDAYMQSSLTDLPSEAPWEKLAPVLDEAVARLGQRDRDVLLLRFFEGRSVAEVGRALGLKEPAAKKRLGRALERMRGFFAKRGIMTSAGALAGAIAANSVQAAPPGLAERVTRNPSVAAGAGGGLVAGLAALLGAWKTPLLVGAACAALGVAGAWLHHEVERRSSVPPVARGSTPASGIPADSLEAGGRGVPAEATTDPLAASADAANQLVIEIVAADSGAPVPNVGLGYWRQEGPQHRYHGSLQSTRWGVCQVPVARDTAARLQIVSHVDGFADTCVEWQTEHGERIPEKYTLRLARSTPIGGRVVDADGAPVAGAQVVFQNQWDPAAEARPQSDNFKDLFGVTAITDADGRWQIDRVAKGTIPTIFGWADHPAHVGSPLIYVKRDPEVENQLLAGAYVFHLGRAVAVSGLVLDPDGQPVSGASVLVQSALKGPDKRPQAAVTARAQSREATTQSDGSFSLAGCEPGKNHLTAKAKGFAAEALEVELAQDLQPLKVTLRPGPILRVRVLNQAGQPVPGADVWRSMGPIKFFGKTGQDGRLVWDSAPQKESWYSFSASNGMGIDVKLTPDGHEHTITLPPALVISGTVCDAASGEPIPKFRLFTGFPEICFVRGLGPTTKGNWNTGADNRRTFEGGRFRQVLEEPVLGGDDDPSFIFKFEAEGYAPAVSRVVGAYEGEVQLDVALRRAAATVITVLLPDGRPAAKAEIGLVSPTSGLRLVPGGFARENELGGGGLGCADQQGRFTLPADDTISRVIAASAEGYAEASRSQLAKEPGITLQPWGRLEGTCLSEGRPAAGRDVFFGYARGHFQSVGSDFMAYRTKTDSEGHFVFSKVPPGKHTLMRMVLDKRPSGDVTTYVPLQKVEVGSGETTRMTVDDDASPETWEDSDFPGETSQPAAAGSSYRVSTRVRWPEGLKRKANWDFSVNLGTSRPQAPLEARSSPRAFAAWEQQPEVQAARAKARHYVLKEAPEGVYVFENVPAGDYMLIAAALEVPDSTKPAQQRLKAYAQIPVTVPADPPSGTLEVPEVVLKPMP
jgi:RNA polymerase sigma factor (sigma-70 family)